ncbi:prepilin-type N-terminal cleavage/methylation domain-containing protein [Pontiellaceae bacterium B1224]|nr:prepilin-type N-terminal cleavage/methylation domain-containing protein [Pontiellaceae bacterium B1224]
MDGGIAPIQSSTNPSIHQSKRASHAGFTLMELLVALAVMGILCGSIAGVLRNAIASVDQGTAALDNLTRMRSLELMLGGALRDARALQLSQEEISMLEEDGTYDSAEGDYRYRGEETALGFCLERPFLGTERDGYMHWIVLEVRTDEETDWQSLWLTDVSFINGVDNPVGEDWGDNAMFIDDAVLPTVEVQLIEEVESLTFRHWQLEEEGMTDEPEPEELEEEDVEGDYALELPDFIEMEIKLPKMESETLYFDYSIRRKGI